MKSLTTTFTIVGILLLYSPFVMGGGSRSTRSTGSDYVSPLEQEQQSAEESSETTNNTGGGRSNRPTQFTEVGDDNTGAYEQAQKAQNKSNNTAMIGMMIAMAALPQCGPTNPYACILGAAGLAVAAMGASKAGQAQDMKNQLGWKGDPKEDESNQETATIKDQVAKGKADLASHGYGLDANGNITLPNGSTLSADDFNSESLQNKAGMSAAQADKLLADIGKLEKDAEAAMEEESAVGIASAAGGMSGGRGPSSSYGAGADGESEIGAGVETASLEEDPSKWNGFFKQYGDSKVGVPQADIFLMVEQRVNSERKVMGH